MCLLSWLSANMPDLSDWKAKFDGQSGCFRLATCDFVLFVCLHVFPLSFFFWRSSGGQSVWLVTLTLCSSKVSRNARSCFPIEVSEWCGWRAFCFRSTDILVHHLLRVIGIVLISRGPDFTLAQTIARRTILIDLHGPSACLFFALFLFMSLLQQIF